MLSKEVSVTNLVFLLFLAFLGLRLQPWLTPLFPYDFQRWLEILMLASVLLLASGAAVRLLVRALHNRLFAVLLAIGLLLCSVSAALSVLGWISWILVFRLWLYCLFVPLLIQAYAGLSAQDKRYCALFVLSLFSIYFAGAFFGVFVMILRGVNEGYMPKGFVNPNFASVFLNLAILLLPALENISAVKSRFFSTGVILLGMGFAFLVFVLGARGSFVASVAAVVAVLVFFRGTAARFYLKRWLQYAAGGGAFFLLVQAWGRAYGFIVLEMFNAGKLLSGSGRLHLYKEGWEGFLNAPWFGLGPLSYAANVEAFAAHPHNILISSLYEFGGLFTALILFGLIWLAHWTLKKRQYISNNVEMLAGVAVISAFVTHSQVSGLPMQTISVMMLCLGAVFCYGNLLAETWPERRELPLNDKIMARLFQISTCLLVVAFVWLALNYWEAHSLDTGMIPRFWVRGTVDQFLP